MRLGRKLGQHFLINQHMLDKIVEYGHLSKSDVVLEVGAGRGDLTERLAERAGEVIAVELDESLAREAESRLKRYPNVRLLIGDILELKPCGFNKVISNPPYSISSKLLEWLINSGSELMVLTLQREFASKLVARPGSHKYVYVSFLSNLFYGSEMRDVIPRRMFRPQPRVDSVIVVMERKDEVIKFNSSLEKFLKQLFTRRRQTLRRVIRDFFGKAGEPANLADLPSEMLSKRVYQLSPKELLEVAKVMGIGSLNK